MQLRQDTPNMNNNTIEHHKIKYGSQIIPFQLEYRKRKTLEISVYPDMSVRVKAPLKRTYCEIEEKVRKRAAWIIEQRYFFSLFLPIQPAKKYISGESHFYLGRQYRLKVVSSTEEKVVLTGPKNNLVPYYQAMDVYVLPSLSETSSLTTMEAMASGVPVITTPVGLIKEYVEDGRNGFFFPKRDADKLFQKIEYLQQGKLFCLQKVYRDEVPYYLCL